MVNHVGPGLRRGGEIALIDLPGALGEAAGLGELDMRRAIARTLSLLALAGAAPATAQPSGASCDLSAYVIDRDARGLNVRAGPSTSARVLRVVSNEGSAVARVMGQRGAWFRVSTITDAESDSILFRGDGWVHASLLGLRVANADPRLYARPSRQSRPLTRLVPEDSQVTLVGCTGDWARVRAGNREGWLSRGGQCSNPVTTCA
jgi:SH3-like domain-containing protein